MASMNVVIAPKFDGGGSICFGVVFFSGVVCTGVCDFFLGGRFLRTCVRAAMTCMSFFSDSSSEPNDCGSTVMLTGFLIFRLVTSSPFSFTVYSVSDLRAVHTVIVFLVKCSGIAGKPSLIMPFCTSSL
jgi:hypothetical protein